MTKRTYFFCIFTMSVALAAGCSTQNSANNSDPHAGMDHNTQSKPANTAPADHSTMDHSQMDHSTMKSSPNAAAADYDLQFIDTMIAHHQGAVDMAKLMNGKAENGELKKMGAKMTVSQQKEIDEMRNWRDKWFAGKPEAVNMEMAGMKDSMTGMDMKKLGSLNGKPFDLEFVKQMIPHHQGAIVMAEEASKRSKRDEIKSLADAIIKEQKAEIEMMKGWQQEWQK